MTIVAIPTQTRSSISAEQHWDQFAQFALWEKAAGGPDPHMSLAGALSEPESLEERRWRIGLYVGFYNVPSAEVAWVHWPFLRVRSEGIEAMTDWIGLNWKGFSFRRERRAVRTSRKMAEYLGSYWTWMVELSKILRSNEELSQEALYDLLWVSTNDNLRYAGRYACFKLLEALKRYGEVPAELPDIRPIGADSPRYTLAWLYPNDAVPLLGGNSKYELKVVERCVRQGIEELKTRVGVSADFYSFEVYLCDYRQSWEGKRQYPGRSQDSELDYHRKIAAYWGSQYKTRMWTMREQIFPYECLGEQMGWTGVRKPLGLLLSQTGITWSDLIYDWPKSAGDPMKPIKRNGAEH